MEETIVLKTKVAVCPVCKTNDDFDLWENGVSMDPDGVETWYLSGRCNGCKGQLELVYRLDRVELILDEE